MLDLRSVRVAYGSATALWDISLRMDRADLLCVVGPNSAGKSTLINTIAGLIRPMTGEFLFDGRDMSTVRPYRFCEAGIAIVPESRRLFTHMTVRENLELGAFAPRARPHRRRSQDHVLDLFPILKSRMDQVSGSLSGGQQQMVAIGRALMACPSLLLLDEPSLGLAPSIVLDMFEAIRRIHASGTAVLLVEQNVSMAMAIARSAAILEEGRIVASGEASELLQSPEVLKAYLGT